MAPVKCPSCDTEYHVVPGSRIADYIARGVNMLLECKGCRHQFPPSPPEPADVVQP